MYLSTQPYIDEVEYHTVSGNVHSRWKEARYPTTFTPSLAELFGYITQCGTLTEKTVEINFADCNLYPLIAEQIHFIFKNEWNHEGLRLNNRGHPRICGKKDVGFVCAVFRGKKNFATGHETIPPFVFESYEQYPNTDKQIIISYLKGVLGPCPKFWQVLDKHGKNPQTIIRLFFRSEQLYKDVIMLLRYVLDLPFTDECGTLVLTPTQLELLKFKLDLTDDSWWKNESWWTEIKR